MRSPQENISHTESGLVAGRARAHLDIGPGGVKGRGGLALVGYRVIEISLPDRLRLDTHLLPGDTSANLFRNINVDYVEIHDDRDPVPVSANAETATTAPAGGGDAPIESVRITASFLGSEAAGHHTLGVTFDPDTGEVTVDNPLPAGTRIQNFLVKATATAKNGAATNSGPRCGPGCTSTRASSASGSRPTR